MLIILITINLVFALITFPLALIAFIELRAMTKSTHKIQYVPIDDSPTHSGKEFLKKMYDEDSTEV